MDIDIYRISDKSSSGFLHEEVCRTCADKKAKEGFLIEFDGHLYKYTYVKNGVSYYEDGSDDDNPEITCSLCGEYLVFQENEPLEGSV